MIPENGLITGSDGLPRCWWPGDDPQYLRYHDEEWGRPVTDDRRLFEKLSLESFQSGLSWLTILRKRENFRAAFDHFDPAKVARYTATDVDRLLADAGIVRHRGKIEAVIHNAPIALALSAEFGGLLSYFQQFPPRDRPEPLTLRYLLDNPATPASTALAKDLKKRGWKFFGPTTAYAFMQSVGLVNDHVPGCHLAP
ncbi:MAG: DNA-3-methyladenine glycosylase I [Verrucomicrobiales bacterium]